MAFCILDPTTLHPAVVRVEPYRLRQVCCMLIGMCTILKVKGQMPLGGGPYFHRKCIHGCLLQT